MLKKILKIIHNKLYIKYNMPIIALNLISNYYGYKNKRC